jgi:hypothetical protein
VTLAPFLCWLGAHEYLTVYERDEQGRVRRIRPVCRVCLHQSAGWDVEGARERYNKAHAGPQGGMR